MQEDESVRTLPRRFQDPVLERYSGETALDDYAALGDMPAVDARLVMIRFLVAQYFTNRLRGDWVARLLRIQRSAAQNAIGTGLVLDRELRLLRRALELDDPEGGWNGTVISLLALAAEAARTRGHTAGAVALNRITYEAAVRERLYLVAAAAAGRMVELLPDADQGGRRRWRRRARTLLRRGQVA